MFGAGLFAFASAALSHGADADALWKSHVEPLLREHCGECHNPNKTKSGLDLSSFQTIVRGGERGSAIVAGKPEESNLYKFLRGDADPHMPPGTRRALSEEEAGLIAAWIKALPAAKAAAAPETNTSAVAAAPAPARITWKPDANMAAEKAVDRFLELAWKLDGITPVNVADDATFARRVYLDLAGRIPNTNELRAFAASKEKDKRARLIETLLASEDYVRHMRETFDTVLMNRPEPKFVDRRESEKWFAYLDDVFRRNRRWDEVVRELIVARPQGTNDRGAVWFLYERENNPQAMAEALAPVVYGVQIKCAQCHDHMIAREIKQAHYWGTVAAFNRSKSVDTPQGPALAESAIGGFVSFANLKKESQRAELTFFNGKRIPEPWPKDGEKEVDSTELYLTAPAAGAEEPKGDAKKSKRERPAKVDAAAVPKFSRRVAFAEAVTKDNPLLARAMVNRVWAIFFGRGLVHPVDLMDSKHPASHPELLDWLAKDFERSGYDVKRLVRTLCNTRAYQLEAKPASMKKGKVSPDPFANALDKPLSAEQLYRSLLIATENQPDASGKVAGMSDKELRRAFVKQFPDLFAPEYNASLQQAMFLANAPLLDSLVTPRDGNLATRLLKLPSHEARVREAFAVIYGREPAKDELRECTNYLAARTPEAGVKQLLWAMLAGAEFQVNH
jgi:mono/diheme cytochrome c family protein